MTTPDEALGRKLDLNQRDALVTAMRRERLAIEVVPNTENQAHTVAFDLTERGLLVVSEVGDMHQDGSMIHVYNITGRGKRVVKLLPEYSGAPLETLWVKIAPNEGGEGEPHWISIDGFDIVALEGAKSMTDQFYMLQPHIPTGWRPIQMERAKPEGVE